MGIKYLKLRIDTFRREYFDISSQWIKNSWSWLWYFTIENFKFLYLGEINQIKYLTKTIELQKKYIESIDTAQEEPHQFDKKQFPPYISIFERVLIFFVKFIIIPPGFCIYWTRRCFRILFCKRHHINISEHLPVEDMQKCHEFTSSQKFVYISSHRLTDLPRGLVLLHYTLDINDNHAEPILYINPGLGFTAEYAIPLPFLPGQKQYAFLLELPHYSKVIKFQLASVNTQFTLKDVYIRELNFFTAALYLKKNYNYGINEVLHALFIKKLPGVRRIQNFKATYPQWHQTYLKLDKTDITAIQKHINLFKNKPLFSIIVQINNRNPVFLKQCLKSLESQLYKNWELLIICGEQPDAHTISIINELERKDNRAMIVIDRDSANISSHIKDALKEARGEYLFILDSEDVLTKTALYYLAAALDKNPVSQLFYSDFDHINQYGRLCDPRFKPDWDYDLFLGKNYIQYLVCYKTRILKALAAGPDLFFKPGELNATYIEKIDQAKITHIPYILVHHRLAGNEIADDTGSTLIQEPQCVQAHIERTKQPVSIASHNGSLWPKWPVPAPEPLISLIVLTRDRVGLLSNCINGLIEETDYKNVEIIVVDNGSEQESTLTYLHSIKQKPNVKVIREASEFNFSRLNNIAIQQANGNYIGLINNDISVIESHWLHEMMGHLVRDEVGIVGPKLLYENNTIQHAGVILGLGGVAGHAFRHQPHHSRGYDDRLVLTQQLSCVTAACLLTKKSIYEEVGGLNETSLKVAFNDVDYCLKVRELGYKIIWTPFATLYHLESASRSSDLSKENIGRWNSEYNYMVGKWRQVLENDPFYNPNLTITDEDFSYSIPPRQHQPWERYLQTKS